MRETVWNILFDVYTKEHKIAYNIYEWNIYRVSKQMDWYVVRIMKSSILLKA